MAMRRGGGRASAGDSVPDPAQGLAVRPCDRRSATWTSSGVSQSTGSGSFYADWYRPDLMAIVAVGDVDPAAFEARVREKFAAIPSPAQPRTRPVFDRATANRARPLA
jgi:hypothetical protein